MSTRHERHGLRRPPPWCLHALSEIIRLSSRMASEALYVATSMLRYMLACTSTCELSLDSTHPLGG